MGRKERRHPEQGPMEIGPPFGDRFWSTPASRIYRGMHGARSLTTAERRRRRDPKEASMPDIVLFFFALGIAIALVGFLLSWIF